GQALEPFDSGFAQRFGIGHDVGLRHRHEVTRAEVVADLDLMLDRPLRRFAALARPQRLFFGREVHSQSPAPIRVGKLIAAGRARPNGTTLLCRSYLALIWCLSLRAYW